MKKFFLSLGLVLTSLSVFGQVHQYQDFLIVRSLQVGTNSVGYAGLTNLANVTTNAGMIYSSTNLAYTNASGTYIHPGLADVVSAMLTTNNYTRPSIFKDVSLWADRNGNPVFYGVNEVSAAGLVTNFTYFSGATLLIEAVSGAWLTNGAVGFCFRPIWDGLTANNRTAEDWWVVLPTSAGVQLAKQYVATNAPMWRWPGAKTLRLVNITNNNTTITGGATTVTNAIHITKIRLNGFVP